MGCLVTLIILENLKIRDKNWIYLIVIAVLVLLVFLLNKQKQTAQMMNTIGSCIFVLIPYEIIFFDKGFDNIYIELLVKVVVPSIVTIVFAIINNLQLDFYETDEKVKKWPIVICSFFVGFVSGIYLFSIDFLKDFIKNNIETYIIENDVKESTGAKIIIAMIYIGIFLIISIISSITYYKICYKMQVKKLEKNKKTIIAFESMLNEKQEIMDCINNEHCNSTQGDMLKNVFDRIERLEDSYGRHVVPPAHEFNTLFKELNKVRPIMESLKKKE